MIKLKNITKIYKANGVETKALDNVDVTIEDGKLVAIIGPSGSGKSTMLNIIGGMDTITEGTYECDDVVVNELKGRALHLFRKDKISFIFQNFALMNQYSVFENVELPLIAKKYKRAERKKIVYKNLELMGIKELAKKYPTQISGGQQQRCAIARALASGNDIILADEPTGALDQKTGEEIMNVLCDLNKMGKTVIIVTHDRNVANKCEIVLEIVDGKLVNDFTSYK